MVAAITDAPNSWYNRNVQIIREIFIVIYIQKSLRSAPGCIWTKLQKSPFRHCFRLAEGSSGDKALMFWITESITAQLSHFWHQYHLLNCLWWQTLFSLCFMVKDFWNDAFITRTVIEGEVLCWVSGLILYSCLKENYYLRFHHL